MKQYTAILAPTGTPQSEPIAGREGAMRPNAAGGYAFGIDDWTLLERFLVLGSSAPTYYSTARELTTVNLAGLERCILMDGRRALARIVAVSEGGRAPKNEPAILALALAAKRADLDTRRLALEALPRVCRTGTHLFAFCEALELFGGWGRATKRAVGRWYTAKDPEPLAYQLTKYQQRGGWSHRDVLRLAHPVPLAHSQPFLRYGAKGQWESDLGADAGRVAGYMEGCLALQTLAQEPTVPPQIVADIIRDRRLPREVVPSAFLRSALVWEALLEDMPYTALIRNLATMTRVGLVAPLSEGTRRVVERLHNAEGLRSARVHPINVLMALRTYAAGHGMRGQHTWTPVPQVVEALDAAFYLAYQNVEPAGCTMLLALDVSGSMAWGMVGGVEGLSPREASAALALVIANTEPQHSFVAFSHEIVPLEISKGMRLHDATKAVAGLPFGRTDCAQPMLWALQHKVPVDTFVVVTDNETYANPHIHPAQALQRYRDAMGRPAKLVVLGMTATECSIADPADPLMLDCVGFDAAVPTLVTDFARGALTS